MSQTTDEGRTDSPWGWPRQWSRQESFWRDVAARALSAGLVSLAGGLVVTVYKGDYKAAGLVLALLLLTGIAWAAVRWVRRQRLRRQMAAGRHALCGRRRPPVLRSRRPALYLAAAMLGMAVASFLTQTPPQ